MNRFKNRRLIRMATFCSILLLLFSCGKQDLDIDNAGLYLCDENGELEILHEGPDDIGVILTTIPVSEIETSKAISGGTATSNWSSLVTVRGVCWSTSRYPTIRYSHTTNGSDTGSFTSSLTGLTANTTYYVRAYAINSSGTAYGNEVSFTTPSPGTLPTVTTTAVSNIAATSATSGGTVTSSGSSSVTARGVCWSTSHNPTVSNNHTTNGSGTGSFTSTITGLNPYTTYYVRAYATNSSGTAYGNEVSFTYSGGPAQDGQPCPGAATLTDHDGNTYNTVQIGTQCWMKENLRTMHYANGAAILQGSTYSGTTAYWYYPDASSSNFSTYGLLYNWKAVMRNSSSTTANPSGVQGICPTGWHVPSVAEWTLLEEYVGSQSAYCCSSNTSYIGKALASTSGWDISSTSCAVGNGQGSNNATGFNALPGGNYGGSYYGFGGFAYFWSATDNGTGFAYYWYLYSHYADVYIGSSDKSYGFSVRCVKN